VIKLGPQRERATHCDTRIKGERQAMGYALLDPGHPLPAIAFPQNIGASSTKRMKRLPFPMAVLVFMLTYAVLVAVLVIYGMCHHEEDRQKAAELWVSLPP
jgi:hypothetical protein